MQSGHRRELAVLKFEGPRFEDHGLDISVLPEIIAYRELVIETAKELWRSKNPGRTRLPGGFDKELVLKFFEIREGSTVIPLEREILSELYPDHLPDLFDDAADVLDDAVCAASRDSVPPSSLPVSIVRQLAQFGSSLSEDEAVAIKSNRHTSMVVFDARSRQRVALWSEPTYLDEFECTGEIRSADLDGAKFSIRVDGGPKISGNFSTTQERAFIDGLAQHATSKLRLKGIVEFYRIDGKPKKIVQVDTVEFVDGTLRAAHAQGEAPLWLRLQKITSAVPAEQWDQVPTDLAEDPDKYLVH